MESFYHTSHVTVLLNHMMNLRQWFGTSCGQVRLLALMLGAGLGSKVAGCPPSHVQVAWLAYVTQAGVALGLIKSLAEHEPVWGLQFSALMTAVVVCNCLVRSACIQTTPHVDVGDDVGAVLIISRPTITSMHLLSSLNLVHLSL